MRLFSTSTKNSKSDCDDDDDDDDDESSSEKDVKVENDSEVSVLSSSSETLAAPRSRRPRTAAISCATAKRAAAWPPVLNAPAAPPAGYAKSSRYMKAKERKAVAQSQREATQPKNASSSSSNAASRKRRGGRGVESSKGLTKGAVTDLREKILNRIKKSTKERRQRHAKAGGKNFNTSGGFYVEYEDDETGEGVGEEKEVEEEEEEDGIQKREKYEKESDASSIGKREKRRRIISRTFEEEDSSSEDDKCLKNKKAPVYLNKSLHDDLGNIELNMQVGVVVVINRGIHTTYPLTT